MAKFIPLFLLLFLFCSPVNASETATKIIVYKSENKMELLDEDGDIIKAYEIAIGGNPIGAKTQAGDKKTPEGVYYITGRNWNSKYHRSLRISYPNEMDIAKARIRNVSAGGDIMIHGLPARSGWKKASLHRIDIWTTAGCIAVTNKEIEEIWDLVPDGARVEILP
jgi:murein L,D-transpeptidase YafK